MRVVLTGGLGFLGSSIAEALAARAGIELICFVRPGSAIAQGRMVEVDLTDQTTMDAAVREARLDAVVHAAGRVPGTPLELYRDNTVATVVLTEAILKANSDCVLTALGSAAEYGRPADGASLSEDTPCRPLQVYGHSKLAAAAYLASAASRGLRYNLLRVFNPVGIANSPHQVLGRFIGEAAGLYDKPAPRVIRMMGRLDAYRDFVAVDDLVRLVVRLLETGAHGKITNVCSGEGRQVRALVQYVAAQSGIDYEIVEPGEPPRERDIVVGDPARFLELAGLAAPTPIEPTLAAAWQRALTGRAR